MADRITITPGELRKSANNFVTKAEQVTEILTFLQNEVNQLDSTWDGAAQDQFFQAYTDMNKTLQQFPEVLKGISQQLNEVAKTIEETDAQLASQLKGR